MSSMDFCEKLYNIGFLESYRVVYTTYKLRDIARDWWSSHIDCQSFSFPEKTWDQLTEAFLDTFMPFSLRDQMRNKFNWLEQCFMNFPKYEARFHSLSR